MNVMVSRDKFQLVIEYAIAKFGGKVVVQEDGIGATIPKGVNLIELSKDVEFRTLVISFFKEFDDVKQHAFFNWDYHICATGILLRDLLVNHMERIHLDGYVQLGVDHHDFTLLNEEQKATLEDIRTKQFSVGGDGFEAKRAFNELMSLVASGVEPAEQQNVVLNYCALVERHAAEVREREDMEKRKSDILSRLMSSITQQEEDDDDQSAPIGVTIQ